LAWTSQVLVGREDRSGSVDGTIADRIDGDLSMTRKTETVVLAYGFALLWGGFAQAGAPQIGSIRPFGVQRGVSSEVTIGGSNLAGNPRLIGPFASRIDPLDPKRSSVSAWSFKLTVLPDVAVGVYVVRVQTDDGLSNPFLFAVGQLPQVTEKEDNTSFESAQALPAPPLVVEGETAGNDVDYFRFAGKKGQVVVIDAQCARIGSGVDPSIRLTTAAASRRFVASADDTPGLLTDARLVAELPEDTDYVVEISDSRYQGAGRPVYRLLIGSVPVADEVFPLGGREGETLGLELRGGTLGARRIAAASLVHLPGTFLCAPRLSSAMLGLPTSGGPGLDVESLHQLVTGTLPELREPDDPSASPLRAVAPVVFNGRIDPPGDEDRFVVAVTAGDRLHIEVEASKYGSALDGVLQVQGMKGSVIASADDAMVEVPGQQAGQGGYALPDPSLDLTVPGGTTEVSLVVRDLEGRGGVGFPYRIVVRPIVPGFELQANDPQVSIPRGGTVALGVTTARKSYNGPILVTVADPPAGLTVRPGTIAPGQDVGALSISAAATAAFAAVPLKLIGRAQGPEGPIEVEATRELVFAKQATLPTSTLTQRGVAAAPGLPAAVTFEAPSEPIEIAHGFGGTIPIKAVRARGGDAALQITTLPLPPGLAVPAASIAGNQAQATVSVNTTLEASLGAMTIALRAKGKFAGGEQTIAIPAVTLKLVRPAELVLSTPAVAIKPGTTTEIKGKVERKGSFNESVTVRLNGLPAGLHAEAVVVAPGASDFVIKMIADAKAAAGSATTQLVSAYQVGKKDYPTSPLAMLVKVLAAK